MDILKSSLYHFLFVLIFFYLEDQKKINAQYLKQIESKITEKVKTHEVQFKNDLRQKIMSMGFDTTKTMEVLDYIFDYPPTCLTHEDFIKEKRIKYNIPNYERCSAIMTDDDKQCSRRRMTNSLYCGIHHKIHANVEKMDVENDIQDDGEKEKEDTEKNTGKEEENQEKNTGKNTGKDEMKDEGDQNVFYPTQNRSIRKGQTVELCRLTVEEYRIKGILMLLDKEYGNVFVPNIKELASVSPYLHSNSDLQENHIKLGDEIIKPLQKIGIIA